MKPDRKDLIAIAFLIVIAVFLWLPRLRGPIDLRWDGGAYYVLGTSLAEGKGYRLLNEPGEIQSTLHPPMLPLIVALHQLILGTNDASKVGYWLRLSYFLLFITYTLTIYALGRKFLSVSYAVLASLICLFQLHTVFLSDMLYPELPFALVTVLFALSNLKDDDSKFRMLKVPLAVIAYALRSLGMALLAAWALESICLRKFKKAALRLLLLIIPVTGWFGYIAYVESGREYKTPAYDYQRADYNYINISYARNMKLRDPFSPELGYTSTKDLALRFANNLLAMPIKLGEAVSTRQAILDLFRKEINSRIGIQLIPDLLVPLVLYLQTALIAGGLWLQWKERRYFIPLYVLLSLAMVCSTPWPNQFNRYLSPLTPFFSLSLFIALKTVVEKLAKLSKIRATKVKFVLTGTFTLLILCAQSATLWMLFTEWHHKTVAVKAAENSEQNIFFYNDQYKALDEGLAWLTTRAKENEIVASSDPQWVYLRTGLKSVLPPFETNASKAQRLLDSIPVKYLLLDKADYRKYTANVVAAQTNCWRQVYTASPDFEIYERIDHP